MKRDTINAAIGIILLIVLFLGASYYVQANLEIVKSFVGSGFIGILVYMFILIFATVVAPVNAMPLIPIASNIWGWFFTGLISAISWTIGSLIAFMLARIYGVPLVKKFFSLSAITRYEKLIPEENIFWSIVFLRMSIPVDILSYLLGLFSHIKFRTYAIATLIGVAPFAFIFAYVGTLQFRYQLLTFLIAVIIILTGYKIKNKYKKRKLFKQKNLEIKNVK